MNKAVKYILIVVVLIISTAAQIVGECDATALKSELKQELKPDYKYDSSKTTRFTFKDKIQTKEIEIPLYMGEKYRFAFNTAGLPKDVKIEIYSKPIGHRKRELIYQLKQKENQHLYSFDPEKSKKMYITYTIPVVEDEELNGCITFLLGYKVSIF
ncbi:MAG: hypothetical protein J5I47_11195 [Vicingus serpentipes]|nr:hypothetical protein [Vicingus serpentipes]